MKIQRTKNAARNVFFGVLQKLYVTVVPFFIRTAMIYFMGVQYLGLNSLFVSVINILNLAELGVDSAMVFSMYKPIAEDDKSTICALMNLYRRYYRIIGLIIAVAGVSILPFIPRLVKDDVPSDINIYLLYLLYLGETVLSYWLFAHKNSLLSAYQRRDLTNKTTIITCTVKYILQLLVLIFIRDYYWFVIAQLATQIMQNLLCALVANRYYPGYKPSGTLSPEKVSDIKKRIRDLFTAKISTAIVRSSDSIVVSSFLGLSVLAVYQNYYFITASVMGFVEIIFSACTAGIGNSIVVESREKNYTDFKKLTLIIAWLAGFCTCCLLCLFQPFMRIWMNGDDTLMLGMGEVICLCVFFYVAEINRITNTYKDAAGLWRETKFVPLANAVVNLTLNLILVQFWGLYGVLLSTVIGFSAVEIPLLLHNLFRTIFDRDGMKPHVRNLVYYTVITALAGGVTYVVCLPVHLNGILTLLVRGMICLVLPNLIFYAAYHNKPEFRQCLSMIDLIAKGRLSKLAGKTKTGSFPTT